MDDENNDDGNIETSSQTSSSIWLVSDNSEHTSIYDHTSSCGSDSSFNSLSSFQSDISAQNDTSIQGSPLESEPHIENGNSEPSEHSKPHIDNSGYNKLFKNNEHSNMHSLENNSKSEGPEVDQEKRGQLKSNEDSVDSNILDEIKEDKRIPVARNYPAHMNNNGKGPHITKRNTGTGTVSNPEVTNVINRIHKDDLSVSKQEDIHPGKTIPEGASGQMDGVSLLQINPEANDNDTSQHEFSIPSRKNISKNTNDASEYKRIKQTVVTTIDSSLVDYRNDLITEDAVMINLGFVITVIAMLLFTKGGGDVHEEDVGDDEKDNQDHHYGRRTNQGDYFQPCGFLSEITGDPESEIIHDRLKNLVEVTYKLSSTLKSIGVKKAFHKEVYDEDFKTTIDGVISNGQSCLVPSQGGVELTVGMVNLNGSKSLPTARDGNGDGEDEDSGEDDEEDSHQNANANTGENPTTVQQSEAAINVDYQQCDHNVLLDQLHHQSLLAECSQPHMVGRSEAYDTSDFAELARLPTSNNDLPSTLENVEEKIAFHKEVHDEDFKKTIDVATSNGQSWLVPSQGGVKLTVGMVNLNGSKSLPTARDGNGDGEDEESEEDNEEDSRQIANGNTGENSTAMQQSGATIKDHQQCNQDVPLDQICHQLSLAACSQPRVVQCSEAVDTGDLTELAGLPTSTSDPLVHEKESVTNLMGLLLSSMISGGGRAELLSTNQWIIKIHGQTLIIVLTKNIAIYSKHLRKSADVVPECVAGWRNHLMSLGVSSTTTMMHDIPTIIAFGGVSVLLPTSSNNYLDDDDGVHNLVTESLKESFMSKIRHTSGNSDNTNVSLVSRRDPEPDWSQKEDAVIEHSTQPQHQSTTDRDTNNFEINCAGRQVASPAVASLTPPCYSGSACPNEDREKLTIATMAHHPNMELYNSSDQLQLISQTQELFLMEQLPHEDPELFNSYLHREEQMYLDEPYALQIEPASGYIEGGGVMSVLQDYVEEFSKAYNVPYNFQPSLFGELFSPSSHNLEDSSFLEDSYPVTCSPLPALANNNHSQLVFPGSLQKIERIVSFLAQIHQLIQNVSPQCLGLRDEIERLLVQDPNFHRSFTQLLSEQDWLLSEQNQLYTVTTLPAVNMGVVVPVLHVESDSDFEKWSKECRRLGNFPTPMYDEPRLLNNPLDSIPFDYHNVTCEALPASDGYHSKVVDSGCKHGGENASFDRRSTLDQVLDSIRQLTPQCPRLCDLIEQLLMQDPNFNRSLTQLLLKQHQPCVLTTLPVINMGIVGVMPILYDGPDNDPEKWSKDYKRPEPFLVPPYMCGELGPLHIPLDGNAVYPYEEIVVCKAHLTSDATDQVVSSYGSEESGGEHDIMTSSSDETGEKFLV